MATTGSRTTGKDAGDPTQSLQDARSRLEAAAREFASGRAAEPGGPGLWRAWLDDNFIFVCIYSPDGTLTAVNPAALAAAGVVPEDAPQSAPGCQRGARQRAMHVDPC